MEARLAGRRGRATARAVVEPLPAYVPTSTRSSRCVLNPVEPLWSNLKGGGAGQPPGDILDDVIAAADHGIQRIRHAHHALVVDGGIERHGLWGGPPTSAPNPVGDLPGDHRSRIRSFGPCGHICRYQHLNAVWQWRTGDRQGRCRAVRATRERSDRALSSLKVALVSRAGRGRRAAWKARRCGIFSVGEGGLEPPPPCGDMALNHARLPVPPLAHTPDAGARLPAAGLHPQRSNSISSCSPPLAFGGLACTNVDAVQLRARESKPVENRPVSSFVSPLREC
jgi:hypothetical protein